VTVDFHGPARPLDPADVTLIAGYLGCQVAAVRAVLAVETTGKGFTPDRAPIILNEPHVFYRELGAGEKRDRAVREGLAYAKWGAKPYPKTQAERYRWLRAATAIDEDAALRSCSWGLGQVMGFNHAAAGFATVHQFVRAMTVSEGAQLYAMARFIVAKNLQRHLRTLRWAAFAKGYNGAGYAKNAYHTKLAAAYAARPLAERVIPIPPPTEMRLNDLLEAPAPTVPAPTPRPWWLAAIDFVLSIFKRKSP
jgi:hypothetical protein